MSDDLYRITLVDGQVSQVEELDDGIWELDRIDRNESYTVNADGTITRDEVERGIIERVTLLPTEEPGVYLEGPEIYVLPDGRTTRIDPDDDRPGRGGFDDVFGTDDDDDLTCGTGDDHARGGRGRDRIDGDRGDDRLEGGAGHDRLTGGWGEDSVDGGFGNDRIRGEQGDDVLSGGRGWDVLMGGADDDVLNGDQGRDRIFGGDGADVLTGGAGRDRLTGGDGADEFVFATGAGRDRIVGFEDGIDRIVFTSGADSLDDLRIVQRGDDVRIGYAGGFIEMQDVDASLLGVEDFVFL